MRSFIVKARRKISNFLICANGHYKLVLSCSILLTKQVIGEVIMATRDGICKDCGLADCEGDCVTSRDWADVEDQSLGGTKICTDPSCPNADIHRATNEPCFKKRCGRPGAGE